MKLPPPRTLLPLLQKVKSVYVLWYGYYQILPKPHRYSLGHRIDSLFIETIEAISSASFLQKGEKQPYVRLAIKKLDTLRILLMVLWETRSLENQRYAALSIPLDEIGKMLGGWNGQLMKSLDYARDKQNSPNPTQRTGEK